MKKILLTFAASVVIFTLFSQSMDPQLVPLGPEFEETLEISSVCTHEGNLVMASEKCGKIFTVDPKTGNTIRTEEVPGIYNRGIEGIQVYKDYFIFSDEKKKNQLVVLHRKTQEQIAVKFSHSFRFARPRLNNNGVEGLELDPDSGIIYVVCEGKKRKCSTFYRLKIGEIK